MRGESQRVAERVRELLDPARYAPDPADGGASLLDELADPEPEVGGGSESRVRRRVVPWWRQVVARVPVQLDPGRRAAVAVGCAVVVVAVLAGAWLWFAQPRTADVVARPTPIAGASSPAGTDAPVVSARTAPISSAAPVPTELIVDVAGKVVHPGLQHLPPGSRVADAVAAAGGPLPGVDLSSVNLAARISDGQQIAIGVTPAPGAAGTGPTDAAGGTAGSAGEAGGAAGGPVNINSAGLEQLQELPGIGPALAQRILDYRTEHGAFHSVDQLNDVSGIGDAKLAALRAKATV